MVLAAYGDGLYKVLLLGHVVALLVAFAPAVVHPILAAQARTEGAEALQRLAAHMGTNGRRVHFPALVVTGALGIALVLVSGDAWSFDQAWVSLAFLVWLALAGVVTAVIIPAERKLAAGDMAAARQVALGGQLVTVLLLVMLYLMVWKPGA